MTFWTDDNLSTTSHKPLFFSLFRWLNEAYKYKHFNFTFGMTNVSFLLMVIVLKWEVFELFVILSSGYFSSSKSWTHWKAHTTHTDEPCDDHPSAPTTTTSNKSFVDYIKSLMQTWTPHKMFTLETWHATVIKFFCSRWKGLLRLIH